MIILELLSFIVRRWMFAALVALTATIGLLSVRLRGAREIAFRAALVADTLMASRDSSRALRVSVAALGESLHVVARRAVQVAQARDALDRELHVRHIARDRVVVQEAPLQRSLAAIAAPSRGDSVRHATFDVRSAPYTVHADVALPPSDSGTMTLRVALDSIPMEVRLSCGERAMAGVRPAVVTVSGPVWAQLRLGRVEQGAELCAEGGPTRRSRVRRVLDRAALFAGYGFTGSRATGSAATLILGLGLRLWP